LWHAVWLENPLPYFAEYPNADVLASTDSVAPTRDDGGLENPNIIGRYDLNVGKPLLFPIGQMSSDVKQMWIQHQHLCVVLAARHTPHICPPVD